MRRAWIVCTVGIVGVLALSACGVVGGEEELDVYAFEPNEISPDELVTCEGQECEEPGALRWSLPLDGDYVVPWGYEDLLRTNPGEENAGFEPTMAHRDGMVILAELDTLTAVDADTGELLWRERLGLEQ